MKREIAISLAIICGFAVANIYYNQPLLLLFSKTFHLNPAKSSLLSTVVQASYALGLILIVPLADIFCRKKIILVALLFNTISQVIAAIAPSYQTLLLANILIGITSITAQIVIPAVSIISSNNTKGKNTGIVMSGLFAGILLARVISGFMGHHVGWRAVYWLSGCINVFLITIVFATFPKLKPLTKMSYPMLIKSLYHLFIAQPILRHVCICGAFLFATFSALWGSLAYLLSLKPYFYNSSIVGLFGLAGIAGILGSASIGTLIDRVSAKKVTTFAAIIVTIAFVIILKAKTSLLALAIGIVILDFGGRASLLSNQLRLFALAPQLRSRLNTVFMSIYFLGGALGTKIGAEVSYHYGWDGLAILGIILASFIAIFNTILKPSKVQI